jgi:hypothetical protein
VQAAKLRPIPHDAGACQEQLPLRAAQSAKIAKVAPQVAPMKNSVAAGEGATKKTNTATNPGGDDRPGEP